MFPVSLGEVVDDFFVVLDFISCLIGGELSGFNFFRWVGADVIELFVDDFEFVFFFFSDFAVLFDRGDEVM